MTCSVSSVCWCWQSAEGYLHGYDVCLVGCVWDWQLELCLFVWLIALYKSAKTSEEFVVFGTGDGFHLRQAADGLPFDCGHCSILSLFYWFYSVFLQLVISQLTSKVSIFLSKIATRPIAVSIFFEFFLLVFEKYLKILIFISADN